MNKRYLLAFSAIFFWSTVAVTTKLLLGTHNNIQVLWISVLLAGIFLFAVSVFTGKLKTLKEYKLKDYALSALICLPGTFFYYVFYYAGSDRMLASQAFIVNYLWPVMSVIFACIILKERLTARKIIAISMSFLGVVIVTSGELISLDVNVLIGAMFCALGAVSYGIFTALNQKFSLDKTISMMIGYFATFAITTVINAVNGDLFLPSTAELLGFAWNGVVTMAVANILWVLALADGNTAKISNLAYITPFASLIWTSLILKEPLNVYFIIGLVIIVLGIFIQLNDKKNTKNQG